MGGEEKSVAPFSRILVAVDKSECAVRAFDYAIRLSGLTEARISVLHVIPPPVAGEGGITAAELAKYSEEEGEELLAQLKARAEKMHPSIKTIVGYMLKEGDPSKVIVAAAKDGHADLIVMGSSGIGGVKELLLGSVSHAVSNHATCPVLIVK